MQLVVRILQFEHGSVQFVQIKSIAVEYSGQLLMQLLLLRTNPVWHLTQLSGEEMHSVHELLQFMQVSKEAIVPLGHC